MGQSSKVIRQGDSHSPITRCHCPRPCPKWLPSQVLVRSSPTPPVSKGEIKKEITVVGGEAENTKPPSTTSYCLPSAVRVSYLTNSPCHRQAGHFNSPVYPLPLVEPITKNKAALPTHLLPSSLPIMHFSLGGKNTSLHPTVPLETHGRTLGRGRHFIISVFLFLALH